MIFHPKKKTSEDRDEDLKSNCKFLLEFMYHVLFYRGVFSMGKSDALNLILAFSCILLSKKKQLPRNYYKTTLYAILISNTK